MPDINTINGLVLCDETNVNGVTIANITNIDGITKSCVSCNTIQLAGSRISCARACEESCITWYTDKDLSVGGLTLGNYIFNNSECTCQEVNGYIYFSNNCGGRSGECFTISDETCEIIEIGDC
tara:strand:+ start:61 stop:432 length:372 start_codon:yes stop_codon:yes gene_type:complete